MGSKDKRKREVKSEEVKTERKRRDEKKIKADAQDEKEEATRPQGTSKPSSKSAKLVYTKQPRSEQKKTKDAEHRGAKRPKAVSFQKTAPAGGNVPRPNGKNVGRSKGKAFAKKGGGKPGVPPSKKRPREEDEESFSSAGEFEEIQDTTATNQLIFKDADLDMFVSEFRHRRQVLIEEKVISKKTNNPIESTHQQISKLCIQYITGTLRILFSWAIPNQEALEAVKAFSPEGVVEIGAGTGLWAHALQAVTKVDVIAYDLHPLRADTVEEIIGSAEDGRAYHRAKLTFGEFEHASGNFPSFTKVHRGGPEKAALHSNRTLLLCWPPPGDSFAFKALSKHYSGNTVVYVGEYPGESQRSAVGLNATSSFFEELKSDFKMVKKVALENMPMVHDYLTIWQRKTPKKVKSKKCAASAVHEDGFPCESACSDDWDKHQATDLRAQVLDEENEAFVEALDGVLEDIEEENEFEIYKQSLGEEESQWQSTSRGRELLSSHIDSDNDGDSD